MNNGEEGVDEIRRHADIRGGELTRLSADADFQLIRFRCRWILHHCGAGKSLSIQYQMTAAFAIVVVGGFLRGGRYFESRLRKR